MDGNQDTYKNDVIELLRNELESRKNRNPNYSLRAFSFDLKMSPAQLSQLISGKRNITTNTIRQISKALLLSPESERQLLSQSLMPKSFAHEEASKKRQLHEDEFHLISEWYHYAILNLSKIKHATADPHWVADRLGISVLEAKNALARLVRLDLIEDGKLLKRKSISLNFESEDPSRAIQLYHKNILNMALDKLPATPLSRRDYSAMTFLADAKKIPAARKMIEEFQDKLTDFLHSPNAKEVFIFSCQVFPLERNKK